MIEVTAIVILPPVMNSSEYFNGALYTAVSPLPEAKCSNVIVSFTTPPYDTVNTIVESIAEAAVRPISASAIIKV